MFEYDANLEPRRPNGRHDRPTAGEVGEVLAEALRPVTLEPLPWPIIDALCHVEDADDWRWVRT